VLEGATRRKDGIRTGIRRLGVFAILPWNIPCILLLVPWEEEQPVPQEGGIASQHLRIIRGFADMTAKSVGCVGEICRKLHSSSFAYKIYGRIPLGDSPEFDSSDWSADEKVERENKATGQIQQKRNVVRQAVDKMNDRLRPPFSDVYNPNSCGALVINVAVASARESRRCIWEAASSASSASDPRGCRGPAPA
jgi:hypothetical protein